MRLRCGMGAVMLLAVAPRCFAPPPLVTGDVPTADKGRYQWYTGMRFQKSVTGELARLLPFSELVYGLTDRQELTLEAAGLNKKGQHGLNDITLGTKYVFYKETARAPGLAGSFELKLPTGSESRGLGTGEFDYDLRLRAQKTWGWFTAIGNVGYTIVSDHEYGGVTTSTKNVLLLAFAQEYQVAQRTKLLSEIYFVGREEPGDDNRLAANIGFKQKLRDDLTFHGAIGKSVREGNRGGPDWRVYIGWKWEF